MNILFNPDNDVYGYDCDDCVCSVAGTDETNVHRSKNCSMYSSKLKLKDLYEIIKPKLEKGVDEHLISLLVSRPWWNDTHTELNEKRKY